MVSYTHFASHASRSSAFGYASRGNPMAQPWRAVWLIERRGGRAPLLRSRRMIRDADVLTEDRHVNLNQ